MSSQDARGGARRPAATLLVLAAISLTLASRLAVARYLANDAPDDGRDYAQLARNILEQHVYSVDTQPPYQPTLIRLPGYPLFLAAIYSVFGHGNNAAVRSAQAVIDTGTCLLVAALAWFWQPGDGAENRRKRRAAIFAYTLAALCPFVVIYTGTILTETLATFLAVAMALTATLALKSESGRVSFIWWAISGLTAGVSVLMRPDSGLFAAALGITLVATGLARRSASGARPSRRWSLSRLAAVAARAAVLSLGFAAVLVPWTIRNERVFHVFQPLAPAHAEMPGEFVPAGYNRWLRTWVDDPRYIEPLLWNLDDKPIDINIIPARAFDSDEERAHVAALLDRYNHAPSSQPPEQRTDQGQAVAGASKTPMSGGAESPEGDNSTDEGGDESSDSDAGDNDTDQGDQGDVEKPGEAPQVEMTPDIDTGFAEIARERIARAPFRYYVALPLRRASALWFDTHSQYYPFEGELFPLDNLDRDLHQQYWLPFFALLTWFYTLLGVAGGWMLWRAPGHRRWLLLVALMTLPRVAFLSTLENPEPRYVVELFPFLAALGGIAAASIRRRHYFFRPRT